MAVNLERIHKTLGQTKALSDINLNVNDGEYVSIVGPSGSGKTTLLKIIADIIPPDDGNIRYSKLPCKDHPVIMVFQDFALFPHMTIAANIGYGLKIRAISQAKRKQKVEQMLDWFGIADKADQYPSQLSAGQQQRVAIARAIVVHPMLLLLDEPFANLDKNLKMTTAQFIRLTQKKFGISTLMMTHDQQEAFVVSDHIGVLMDGQLRQFGTPQVIRENPIDGEVANFLNI